MFVFISRTSRRRWPPLSLSSVRQHLLYSSSTTTSSSNLYDKYSFKPPISLHKNPNPNPNPDKTSTTTKKAKPPYRPPSSLDCDGQKPTSSDLPFDLRFSYTESDPAVRPIGLREAKYSPLGPNRLDRVRAGMCAPAVDPRLGSVDDGNEDPKLEEKRSKMRERILGEPLTSAEKKALVDRCQRNRDNRQINLGMVILIE